MGVLALQVAWLGCGIALRSWSEETRCDNDDNGAELPFAAVLRPRGYVMLLPYEDDVTLGHMTGEWCISLLTMSVLAHAGAKVVCKGSYVVEVCNEIPVRGTEA